MDAQPHRLDRLRYWQGQLLRSQDLQDQLNRSEHLRWWHNRMHNAYGVGAGLQVVSHKANTLTVSPGVAYDAFGREIWLLEEKTMAVPAAPDQEMVLLATFQSHTGHEPKLHWKPANQLALHDGVILARLLSDGQLNTAVPQARAIQRPYIRHGATIPSNTAWEFWEPQQIQSSVSFFTFTINAMHAEVPSLTSLVAWGAKVVIDTSAAGFAKLPYYFAFLQGTPILQNISQFQDVPAPVRYFVGNMTVNEFTFFVYLFTPNIVSSGPTIFAHYLLNALRDSQIWVSWLGIEPLPNGGPTK